jgi:DNA-binding NarL/FixJ family response regulator
VESRSTTLRALVSIADHRQASHVRATLVRRGVFVVDHTRSSEFDRDCAVQVLVAELHPVAIELARTLHRRCGTVAVFLVRHIDAVLLRAAAEIEAAGVVTAPIEDRQLEATVRFAILRYLAANPVAPPRKAVLVLGAADARLRPREWQIASLLLQHKRVPAIAQRLGISPQTVRNHLKNAFRRTGTRSQQELLDWLCARARPASADATCLTPAIL